MNNDATKLIKAANLGFMTHAIASGKTEEQATQMFAKYAKLKTARQARLKKIASVILGKESNLFA
jgi:hypothetical protein